jgi:hypothetical protein
MLKISMDILFANFEIGLGVKFTVKNMKSYKIMQVNQLYIDEVYLKIILYAQHWYFKIVYSWFKNIYINIQMKRLFYILL